MAEKNKLAIGDILEFENYGDGEIVSIDSKNDNGKMIEVYHVRFNDGDVRHYTKDELI